MVEKLGKYRIEKELGRGGMGVVLLGHDPDLDRKVAIKVLARSIVSDETLIARFRREARAAASLNHPNVIQIHSIGEDDGQLYFVMEFVKGESLSELLEREGKLSPEQAAGLLLQSAQGVAAAHDRQIIHRDIKPGNIMIDQKGLVKVTDFGIAWAPEAGSKLTATGMVMGTPGYIPPEVCTGQSTDARSDIFSLGIVYFEMLTGRLPFHADSPLALMQKVVTAEIPDVRQINNQVDEQTRAILDRMVRKKKEERFSDCHALIEALQQGPAQGFHLKGATLPHSGAHAAAPPPLPDEQPTEILSVNPGYDAPTIPTPELPDEQPTEVLPMNHIDSPTEPVGAPIVSQPSSRQPPPVPVEVADHAPPPVEVVPPPPARKQRSPMRLMVLLPLAAIIVLAVGWVIMNQSASGDTHQTGAGGVTDTASKGADPTDPAGDKQTNDPDVDRPDRSAGLTDSDNSPENRTSGGDNESSHQALTDREPVSTPSENQSLAIGANNRNSQAKQTLPDQSTVTPADKARSGEDDSSHDGGLSGSFKDQPASRTTSHSLTADTRTENLPESSKSPVEPMWPMDNPQVGVVAVGDTLLADPAAAAMEEYLRTDRLETMDMDMVRLPSGDNPSLPDLLDAVEKGGGDVLVFVKVSFLDQRRLQFGGRSSTAYRSRLEISCYRLHDRKRLGSKWEKEVEYTSLNARQKAEEATRRISSEINKLLRK